MNKVHYLSLSHMSHNLLIYWEYSMHLLVAYIYNNYMYMYKQFFITSLIISIYFCFIAIDGR